MDKSCDVEVGALLYRVDRVDVVQHLGWHAWEYEVLDTEPLASAKGNALARGKGWTYAHGVGCLLQLRAVSTDAPVQRHQIPFWLHPTMLGTDYHADPLDAYRAKQLQLWKETHGAATRLERASADLKEIAHELDLQLRRFATDTGIETEDNDVHNV
jgi:hypothetical protein